MNKRIALVDNDFIQKIAEIQRPKAEIEGILQAVFQSMNIDPGMHTLVYKNEFMDIHGSGLFFEHGIIRVITFEEMFQDDLAKQEYYCFLVPELYKKFSGEELGYNGEEVILQWKRRSSLGEVHSLAACFVCDYGLFLSDDHGSRQIGTILRNEYKGTIVIYSRKELMEQLPSGIITKKEKNAFKHER